MHLPLLLSSATLARVLLDSLWQALALTAVVALLLRLVPELSAAARSALWTGVLVALLALPLLTLLLPHPALPQNHTLHLAQDFGALLVALWAGAAAFRLTELGISATRLRRLLRSAVPAAPTTEIAALLATGPRRVRLCTSALVQKPSVAGFLRPCILLPPTLLAGLSEAELAQVVLHELEHLRRYDDWINLLQQISQVLLPLNPALVWLNRRLSFERELACDDQVLAGTHARKAYALCLARVAENSLAQRGASLALGILGRAPELKLRVERILRGPQPQLTRYQTRLASGMLLGCLVAGAGVLAHCPEWITFAPAAPMLAQVATLPALPPALATSAVVHGSGSYGHLQLASAILPARTTPAHLISHSPRVHTPAKPHIHRLRRTTLPDAPRLVPTRWSQTPALTPAQPRVRLANIVVDSGADTQVWYTAIAWRGGWLVVQL